MAILVKQERIDLRVAKEDKALLDRAATSQNLSLSSYIMSICLKQAQIDLVKQESIKLSNHDWRILMQELDNPSKPNSALKKLFK
ncbi:MAG: DUF1778 domain-containing protein [Bacilli bacterium]|nr:DUF1778 domain-containing protein [Bacilli bacterium]